MSHFLKQTNDPPAPSGSRRTSPCPAWSCRALPASRPSCACRSSIPPRLRGRSTSRSSASRSTAPPRTVPAPATARARSGRPPRSCVPSTTARTWHPTPLPPAPMSAMCPSTRSTCPTRYGASRRRSPTCTRRRHAPAVGGDHIVSYPILRALGAKRPLGMIHIDAHSDTGDTYFGGQKLTHGTPFRRAVEDGVLDPNRTVQIGIRGTMYSRRRARLGSRAGHPHHRHGGGRRDRHPRHHRRGAADRRRELDLFHLRHRFHRSGLCPRHRDAGDRRLTSREALQLVRGFRHLNLVGADVVEVSPPLDPPAARRWSAPRSPSNCSASSRNPARSGPRRRGGLRAVQG